MITGVLCVCIFAATWALPKGQNEPNFKRMYVDPAVTDIWKVFPKITNGVEADPHSIPYQVYLIASAADGLGWLCGGSLISTRHVLTAAHCIDGAFSATVYLGAHNIQEAEPNRVVVESKNLIPHEHYDESTINNDIGIIVLKTPVVLNQYIGVIRLPTRAEATDYEGVNARVSGWGRVAGDAATSPVLRWVNSTVISNFECNQVFLIVTDSELCISGNGGVGSCNGDSGGPLVYDNILIGVVSYGARGCAPGYPSAFDRVTSYLDWIERYTGLKF